MKKTLTVNLNGRVINIDEDAYELLENYFHNLRIYFSKDTGCAEIITDFEARIEELFSEYIRPGHEVITIEDTDTVIARVGKPEDFGDLEKPESDNKKQPESEKSGQAAPEKKITKKLYRDEDEKMLGGVCSGIAAYFGWDVTPIRLVLLLLIFVPYFTIVWLYLIFWIVVPVAKSAQQKLEMRGEEVSLENIGKIVSEKSSPADKADKKHSLIDSLLNFFVSIFKIGLIGLGILIGFPFVLALVVLLIVAFAILLGIGGILATPFYTFRHEVADFSFTNPTLALVALIFLTGIPLLLIIYSVVAYFAKLSPLPKSIKWTSLIVWIIALILFFCSGFKLNMPPDFFSGRGSWRSTFSNNRGSVLIEGNNEMSERIVNLEAFNTIRLDEVLLSDIQLEQNLVDTPRMVISGESNLIDKIEWSVEDNQLSFNVKDGFRMKSHEDIKIKIIAPMINKVEINSHCQVTIPRKFQSDNLHIKLDGTGRLDADSLFVGSFYAGVDGVGGITVRGKASEARLALDGVGSVDALGLVADTVYADLDGVGSIKCNPLQRLEAKVDGAGSITYKSEPASKNVNLSGVGNVAKE